MFIGRQQELTALNNMYDSKKFEMAVIYGRRRVGKTALIDQFIRKRDIHALRFTARQQDTPAILRSFGQAMADYFGSSYPLNFESWEQALNYLIKTAQRDQSEKFILVFDEFPYAASADTALPSTLQIAIDHGFLQTNAMIVLSGSNQGFMETQVLGGKSPLYGRRTGQIHLKPFDCLTAAEFYPTASAEDCVRYYATLGGTPYYLSLIDPQQSFRDNVTRLCFTPTGLLYEEPQMLLREELRDPSTYDSAIEAIGDGANTLSLVADRTGVSMHTLTYYLKVLESLHLIERRVPFGENPHKSKKSRLFIKDPFFAFWYRFISPSVSRIEAGNGAEIASHIIESPMFATFLGQQFEEMCMQWLPRNDDNDRIPLLLGNIGKWWGNNPQLKEQTDIDIVAKDPFSKKLLLGECKWRNDVNETEMINDLFGRRNLIKDQGNAMFAFLTKKKIGAKTLRKYLHNPDVIFIDAEEMFQRPLSNEAD